MLVIARRDRLSQNLDDHAAALATVAEALGAEGCTTLGVLADALEALGKTTRCGGRWLVSNVGKLLARLPFWAAQFRGIVDRSRVLLVSIGAPTKIGLNNTDYNDQGAFDAANNHFVAPVDGTYLFGATLFYKINASTSARMRGRLVLNGTTEIRGSLREISATHVSLATAIWLQTLVPLTAGDTVELQGYFRVVDGYFAADHTSFWGCKVG